MWEWLQVDILIPRWGFFAIAIVSAAAIIRSMFDD